jgi:hypothetical protein
VGGTLSLPAVYWLAREVFGPRRALVAMGLVAFGLVPLIVSRWGWTLALLLTLSMATVAATLAALRTRRMAYAILAGILLGLSLHTHAAAWAAAGGLLLHAVLLLKRPDLRRLIAGAVAGCLLAAIPYVVGFADYPALVGGRARDVSVFGTTKDVSIPGGNRPGAPAIRLPYNMLEYTGLFLWTSDPNPRHGFPGRPPFLLPVGVAALIGIALALGKVRQGDESPRRRSSRESSQMRHGKRSRAQGASSGTSADYPRTEGSFVADRLRDARRRSRTTSRAAGPAKRGGSPAVPSGRAVLVRRARSGSRGAASGVVALSAAAE